MALVDLIKHQRKYGVTYGWCYLTWVQLTRHRDFFIQPAVYICCTLPFGVILLTGIYIDDDCTQINRIFVEKRILIYILGIFFVPVLFAFPVYIWPSKIYMTEFQTSSIVGKCYMKLKSKCYAWLCQNYKANENELKQENTYV
jgi:hypothetical protein